MRRELYKAVYPQVGVVQASKRPKVASQVEDGHQRGTLDKLAPKLKWEHLKQFEQLQDDLLPADVE